MAESPNPRPQANPQALAWSAGRSAIQHSEPRNDGSRSALPYLSLPRPGAARRSWHLYLWLALLAALTTLWLRAFH
ncbi:MAG TPA: hypothetical protein VMI93_09520 [Candidatus Solibacter sp.]|nr:hypothetical protein [Candidatus Solibacter sp.]